MHSFQASFQDGFQNVFQNTVGTNTQLVHKHTAATKYALKGVQNHNFEVENGARDLQNEAREVIGKPLGRRGRSGTDFYGFLMIFGRLLGSTLRVFSHQIRIEFSKSFLEASWRHFISIWESFGPDFESFWA